MKILRTPDERFAHLVDWPYPPRYVEVVVGDGSDSRLLLHYVDVPPGGADPDQPDALAASGDRETPAGLTVLALHGEPSWGYLYRSLIPVLSDAGLRVVVPDLVGFGRSDKPAEVADHTYARHVAWMRAFVDTLELERVILLGQDWGGLIGLRLVAADPDRYVGVVAANTGLPDGNHRLPPPWWAFRDFVARTPELPIGLLMERACVKALAPGAKEAYEAPFPDASFQAGPHAMPDLIPQTPDAPETPAQLEAWDALRRYRGAFVCAFSDGDPITAGSDRPFRTQVPGAAGRQHPTIAGAGHFLQEDAGPALAAVVVDLARSLG